MFEAMLTEEQRALRDEARDFARWVPRQLILDMDADQVEYPREFVHEAGRRNLLGLRFPAEYGGRALRWEDEIVAIEEVGVLGTALACAYVMPSIVGEALNAFGTPNQKERWLVPLLTGERIAAEALTEPRGGSDFFGTTTEARREGDHYVLRGQKRFIVGAAQADFFLVYARTDPRRRLIAASVPSSWSRAKGSRWSTCTGSWAPGAAAPAGLSSGTRAYPPTT